MYRDSANLRRVCCSVLLVSAVASFGATGCSDVTPASDDEGGGVLESQTNQADQLRQTEEQEQEQNREGGGGGRR